MDIASITAGYQGLKIGKDILKSLYETKVTADAKEQIDEVMSKLGEAQDILFSMREELFRLQSENDELKKKISEAESWENKLSNYELTKTDGGAVVYKYTDEPEHYICTSCVSNKSIQILQDNRTMSGKFRCVACKAEFPVNPSRRASVRSTGVRY